MLKSAFRLVAVCLTLAPAVSAAHLPHSSLPAATYLLYPDSPHGFDWNAFILPAAAPLAFLDASDRPASVTIPPPSELSLHAGASPADVERRAFGWTVVLIGFLLALMQLIPKFHGWRIRMKSLNQPVPVH